MMWLLIQNAKQNKKLIIFVIFFPYRDIKNAANDNIRNLKPTMFIPL